MLRLHRGAVHDQARGRPGDLGHLDQAVRPERLARLDQVDDALGQPDEGRQLDRAVQAHDLHLDTAIGEVLLGQPRILRRHAHPRPLRRIIALPQLAGLRYHQAAEPEAEVERLVDVGLLLEQDVLAHDPQVGRAVEDVRGNVRRLEEEQAEPAASVGEDQLPRVLVDAVDAELVKQPERGVEQATLRQGERELLLHRRRSMRAPSVLSFVSSRS
jgi:hypothetical protein